MRRVTYAACALIALVGVAAVAPASAWAQTATNPPAQQQTVVMLPFTGNATQDAIDDAEAAVRNGLLTRGSRVPERSAVNQMIGVDTPRDAQSIAGLGRNMSAAYVVSGSVRPLSGQYDLTLTLTQVSDARQATRQDNVGGDNSAETVSRMLTALFDPAALGPAPVDPEEERRRREAEQRRVEEEARRTAERRRTAEEQRRRQADDARRAYELAHPTRTYDQGGPFALGLGLHVGGLISDTRAAPTMPRPGAQLSTASSLAFMLRLEGAYAIRAASGLEVLAALMLMTTPTVAVGIGAGAQYTFPATGRSGFRGTGGVVLGLFQGASGAQISTLWIEPFARAQYEFTPSVAVFAGLTFDIAPGSNGGVTTLTANAGMRFRLGG